MEQLAHNILNDTKHIFQLLTEKDSKLQSEVTDPTIHQAEAGIVVLTTRTNIWPKRPTDKQVRTSLLLTTPGYHLENPDYSSMSPKNTPPPLRSLC